MRDDAATFRNPVLGGDRPDPAVIKIGDEYWMTYSSFESAPGLLLYRSRDLVNWTYECAALPEPLGSTLRGDPFDDVVVILFNSDWSVRYAYCLPLDAAIRHHKQPGAQGCRLLIRGDDSWRTDPSVEQLD